jgi:hypothetical protein
VSDRAARPAARTATGTATGAAAAKTEPDVTGDVSPWRDARPELTIAAVAVTATALAGALTAGWGGLAVVAIGAAALSMLVVRGLVPPSAPQSVRRSADRQTERPIVGYAQRRFVVATSLTSRATYESDLRPLLEHLLAARLAENHGINLYTDPAAARRAFCRSRGDEALWRWIDPAQSLSAAERDRERRGITHRTLARLVSRLEQL